MGLNFNLVSKSTGIKFTEYKGNAIRLSKFAPYSVDEVVLKNGNKERKITTFRDSKGNMTERVFDYSDKPVWNRLYNATEHDTKSETVVSTTKKDYTLDRDAVADYKDYMEYPQNKNEFLFWDNKDTITDHVAYNLDKDEVVLTQVKINNKPQATKQKHTFTEYPKIVHGKIKKHKPKELSFEVKRTDNKVMQKSIKATDENLIPQGDSYLGYRALPIEDAKVPLVKRFLKERNMDNKDVRIEPQYNPRYENDGFMAVFDPESGSVKFNRGYQFQSKSRLVNTARHETEHSWQYYLQAVLNGGGENWQNEIAKKSSKITDKKILKEAKDYDKSIENYVPFYVDRMRYRNNYIEIKAREAGEQAQTQYDNEGKFIRGRFKHIPPELL